MAMQSKDIGIKPARGRILVERAEVETRSIGGVLIPEATDKEESAEGFIVEVGPGRIENGKEQPMQPELKPGRYVYFSRYGGNKLVVKNVDGKSRECVILNEDDIIAFKTDSNLS